MKKISISLASAAATALLALQLPSPEPIPYVPVTLQGSPESMIRQNRVAVDEGFTFFRTPQQISAAVARGELVPLEGNRDYEVLRPGGAALPEVRLFIERFSREYRAACGERLVVTSLTRATTRQPRNAHPLSVHPAGMAIDLRVPRNARCRNWLERRLLAMEADGVLDATRERNPPHYHVALFPSPYLAAVTEELLERFDPAPGLAGALGAAGAAEVGSEFDLRFDRSSLVNSLLSEPEEQTEPHGWSARLVRLLTLPARALGVLRSD